MIITLVKANFSTNHIGILDSFSILTNLGMGCIYDGPFNVKKNDSFNATITIKDNYEFNPSAITVTMGGQVIADGITIDNNVITINISNITGVVSIMVPTTIINPDIPDIPAEDEVYSSGTLFLQNGALSVVKGENFFVSLNSDTSKYCRLNSSSFTEGTGIWVPADATITLTGTEGLRFDYVYATKNAANSSTDKTSNLIGGVGTASNFVSSNYFPYNTDGSNNTISITNNYGQGYYYYFAIAAPNKTDRISPENYNITYVVKEPQPGEIIDTGALTLHQGALSVVAGEAGQVSSNNTKRMTSASTSNANGILVPVGGRITLTGLAPSGQNPVKFDCVWASSAGPNPVYKGTTAGEWEHVIAIDSNYVASNYFPHNAAGNDTYTVTNNQSSDCYVFFAFSGLTKSETTLIENYTITYTVVR